MKRFNIFMIIVLFSLTGCWNNQELDSAVFVQGVGLSTADEADHLIKLTVEIIKPTVEVEGGSESAGSGQQIVLEQEAETYLEAARELIAYAKRRLHFDHTRVFIIHEDLAMHKDFTRALDTLRRDRMLRLESYLFLTAEDPIDILSTQTLYESLTSNELVSALEQTRYITEYAPVLTREYFKKVEGPIPSAYIPIIKTAKNGNQTITLLQGTAVIHNGKMVGQLNENESEGLNFLLNQVKGGSISIIGDDEKKRATLEVTSAKTEITPRLDGQHLKVDIETKVEGTLADNMTPLEINEEFFKKLETKIADQIKKEMRSTLNTLQDLKADITDIGIKTYQKYPERWDEVSSNWDNIFANADISIHVDANYTHEGLINKSVERHLERPDNHPYRFLKDFFTK